MKKIFFMLCIFKLCTSTAQTSTVSYQESVDAIANPERGFEKYSITDNSYNTVSNYSNIDLAELNTWKTGADKITVIHRNFLLSSYINAAISNTYLQNIQLDFDRIRTAGFKCIVRFYYSDSYNNTNPQQASKAHMLAHIAQLAPIVANNKDIVFSVQMGFIGTWGEAYYTNSTEFGTEGSINTTQWANRKEIMDAMLTALPTDIFLQVRYPGIKKTMYGSQITTEATAYSGTTLARIGFFDDAFLNDWGDQGTFPVGSQNESPVGTTDYTYMANETQFTPMSGESNGLNPPRTLGTNAIFELDSCNWTTLNRDYFTAVINGWINSNDYATILQKLGYRFVLKQSSIDVTGSALNLALQLQNVGFARALFQRDVYLVLSPTAGGTSQKFLLNTDVRKWVKTINLSQQIDISSLAAGTYDCFLYLPDHSIADNSAYAIRLANTSLWSEQTGYNDLKQQVTANGVTTSIDHKNTMASDISIYPNPFDTYLSYRSGETVADEITVLNAFGSEILKLYPNTSTGTIQLPDTLSSGLYFIVFKKEGKTVIRKITKG